MCRCVGLGLKRAGRMVDGAGDLMVDTPPTTCRQAMAKKDWLDRLFDLNSRMFSTEFEAEAAECRKQINKLLKQHGKSANDIAELFDIVQKRRASPSPPPHNRSRHP